MMSIGYAPPTGSTVFLAKPGGALFGTSTLNRAFPVHQPNERYGYPPIEEGSIVRAVSRVYAETALGDLGVALSRAYEAGMRWDEQGREHVGGPRLPPAPRPAVFATFEEVFDYAACACATGHAQIAYLKKFAESGAVPEVPELAVGAPVEVLGTGALLRGEVVRTTRAWLWVGLPDGTERKLRKDQEGITWRHAAPRPVEPPVPPPPLPGSLPPLSPPAVRIEELLQTLREAAFVARTGNTSSALEHAFVFAWDLALLPGLGPVVKPVLADALRIWRQGRRRLGDPRELV